jgi:hypothetical protein
MTAPRPIRNAYPAVRAFIFGQEVTRDIISCSVNWSDAIDSRAPGTAELVLQSKNDRYVMTEKDIHALYDDIEISQVDLPEVRPMILTQTPQLDLESFTNIPAELSNLLLDQASVIHAQRDIYGISVRETAASLAASVKRRLQRVIRDPVKQRVVLSKFDKVQSISQPAVTETTGTITNLRRANYLSGQAFRYPFAVGTWVFHSNDPVRIFFRDPFYTNVWYYMFSGFVSDLGDRQGVDNEKIVTIRCEDVLRSFRYARIATNPGIFDIDAVEQVEDFVVRTFFESGFSDLTLEEFLYTIVFGPELAGTIDQLKLTADQVKKIHEEKMQPHVRYAANGGKSTQSISRYGVGSFNFRRSMTFVYGPPVNDFVGKFSGLKFLLENAATPRLRDREVRLSGSDGLAIYQSVVQHRVMPSDLESMVLEGATPISRRNMRKDASGEVKVEDVITQIGENPHLYPVDGGRVIALVPENLGPGTNRLILQRDFINSIATQTTFKNRLTMLLDFFERIEFALYASPKGDLVIEMPLYDFDPGDFGESAVAVADALAKRLLFGPNANKTSENATVLSTVGPFAPHYRIGLHNTMDHDRTFADEHMRTQFRTTWQNIQGYNGGSTGETIGQTPQVTTLRALVPQFGVRIEQAEPTIFIASPEAAKLYSEIKLNKWNSESLTSQIDVIPTLAIGPNRPLEFEDRKYIATSRSIGHSLDWDSQDMSMRLGVNYARVWDGQLDADGRSPLYAPIGGFASRPLNFAVLFKKREIPATTKPRENTPDVRVGAKTRKKYSVKKRVKATLGNSS